MAAERAGSAVYDAIKAGLYKFISVELLRDVQAGTREIPFVLDAVALLGATPPAVGSLKDLQQLTMRRRPVLQFAERCSFTRNGDDDGAALRAQIAALQAQLLRQQQDSDITTGRCLPAERARFDRCYRDDATKTVETWNAWVADVPRPPALNRPAASAGRVVADDDALPSDAAPDAQVVFMTRQAVEKSGNKLTYYAAQREVLKANPELADRYRLQPGVK